MEVRKIAGKTQRELAAETGISKETISRYENGKLLMTVEAAHKIAKATGAMAGYILTGETGEISDDESPPGYHEFVEHFGHLFDPDMVKKMAGTRFYGRFGLTAEEMTAKRYLGLARWIEEARG